LHVRVEHEALDKGNLRATKVASVQLPGSGDNLLASLIENKIVPRAVGTQLSQAGLRHLDVGSRLEP